MTNQPDNFSAGTPGAEGYKAPTPPVVTVAAAAPVAPVPAVPAVPPVATGCSIIPVVANANRMTVRDAICLYHLRSEGSTSALRQAVNVTIDNRIRTAFNNDSYVDALVLTEIMLTRTNHRLCVFTGDGEGGFFRILENFLEKALERIDANNGIARFIVLSKTVPSCLAEMLVKFPKRLQVMLAGTNGPAHHFIVSDSTMARMEEPHQPLTENSMADEIKAKVFYNEPAVSDFLEKQFQSIWNIVKDFPVNKPA